MFRITAGSCRTFSLAEILIRAAMNADAIDEMETNREIVKGLATESITDTSCNACGRLLPSPDSPKGVINTKGTFD